MIKASDEVLAKASPSVRKTEKAVAMTVTRKFLFERSFDEEVPTRVKKPEQAIPEAEEAEPEVIVPTFSEEEMQAARDEAFAKGKEEGVNEAAAAMEREILSALKRIEEQFAALFKSQEDADASILDSAISIAAGIARKVFPALNEQGALAEVEHMVVQTMGKLLEEPVITIYVHPDLAPMLNERMGSLSAQSGFKGDVQINATEDIPIGDCRVEWNSGGAWRDINVLWQEIDEIVERNLSGLSGSLADSTEDASAETAPSALQPTMDAPVEPHASPAESELKPTADTDSPPEPRDG